MSVSQQYINGEWNISESATGGQKEVKLERFDLMPSDALADIARVYGYGASKYDNRNWEKGYEWGKSFAAIMRHLWAFWRGNDLDDESGLPHLAHAGFHVLTLLTFWRHYPQYDDRSNLNGHMG